MSADSSQIDSASETDRFDAHLRQELRNKKRAYTLDMDDEPERSWLESCGVLHDALVFLNTELRPSFVAADEAAIKHQGKHRTLAGIAIFAGTFAVVIAIIQLGLGQTTTAGKTVAQALEALAVIAGVVAVWVGLKAKFDHQWFIQRHKAERLRNLKFLSLGRTALWEGRLDDWKQWVKSHITEIANITRINQVETWAEGGKAEPHEPKPPPVCAEDEKTIRALGIFFRWKRVQFQAAYFRTQADKFHQRSKPLSRLGLKWSLRHYGLPLFLLSICAVVGHFLADWLAHGAEAGNHAAAAHIWKFMATWTLVLAALLPVLSLGVRAWLGAFEHVRSASLFEAKQNALIAISARLAKDDCNLGETMHHIAHVEHFLEHEHREWLRLLLDAEWFV